VQIAASFIEDTVFRDGGNGLGRLSYPNDLAVAANGDIYVVNQGDCRIQVFDSTMRYKTHLGEGIFDYPLKVSVDDRGWVFAADYNSDGDRHAVYVFDGSGVPIDTILDSTIINDIDAKDGRLYLVTEGRFISVHSYDGVQLRIWQASGQDAGKRLVAGDANRIFVSTGLMYPEKNKVVLYDSLGNKISSISLPYYPYALAFDALRQLLYIVCYSGAQGSVLHVIDRNNVERARYKIRSDDQNISIGVLGNGTVYATVKNEGKILKLRPLFR
jgi:DNA-binding beta-propeller fold protein YncE